MNTKHYIYLDVVRQLAALAAALHMLGFLEGGWLAVCTLLAAAGYIAVRNSFAEEKFSVWRCWLRLFLRIWVPALAVVCLTVLAAHFLPSVIWIPVKPESFSALLGFNNYWQLGAGRNAFADLFTSPLTHMWAASILMQFAVVFPLLFVLLRWMGNKLGKAVPCWITLLLGLFGFAAFGFLAGNDLMSAYYGSVVRASAIFLGMFAALVQHYYGGIMPAYAKKKPLSVIIFCVYTALWVYLVCFAAEDGPWMWVKDLLRITGSDVLLKLVLVTLISTRMLGYGAYISEGCSRKALKAAGGVSCGISYELYLLFAPLIFLAPHVLPESLGVLPTLGCIGGAAVIGAAVLHFAVGIRKGAKAMALRIILLAAVVAGAGYGGYQLYNTADSNTAMAGLKEMLHQNIAQLEQKNDASEAFVAGKEKEYKDQLDAFQAEKDGVPEIVKALPITGLGDSVMLGAKGRTLEMFPNGYIDATVGDTANAAPPILRALVRKGQLGSPVIFNYGANGDVRESVKDTMMELVGDRPVYWLTNTATKSLGANDTLREFAKKYSNIKVVDWYELTRDHPEYFGKDGLHLTGDGQIGFAQVVYDAIYEDYIAEIEGREAQAVAQQDAERAQRICFIGNDLLAEVFPRIEGSFGNAYYRVISNERFAELRQSGGSGFALLKTQLEASIREGNLPNKVVLLFDTMSGFTAEEYKELAKLCEGRQLSIVAPSGDLLKTPGSIGAGAVTADAAKAAEGANVLELDLSGADKVLPDRIHLSDSGIAQLAQLLLGNVK